MYEELVKLTVETRSVRRNHGCHCCSLVTRYYFAVLHHPCFFQLLHVFTRGLWATRREACFACLPPLLVVPSDTREREEQTALREWQRLATAVSQPPR